ncbi:MAG: hypothetical protein GC166_05850 [Alphaproteobacteria bacterium]|nr:hypothetical protein [Alphaproteobacteria bacterium]
MANITPFQLSRIYAEGWNAAGKMRAEVSLDPVQVADANPYDSEPQRTRWLEGVAGALRK